MRWLVNLCSVSTSGKSSDSIVFSVEVGEMLLLERIYMKEAAYPHLDATGSLCASDMLSTRLSLPHQLGSIQSASATFGKGSITIVCLASVFLSSSLVTPPLSHFAQSAERPTPTR